MTVKFILIDYSGGAGAAINRCTCFIEGLKERGVNSSLILFQSTKKNKISLAINYFLSIIKLFVKAKKGEIFILYGYFPLLFLFKILKIKECLIIGERNEYPNYVINNLKNEEKSLKSMTIFDGFITCTNSLKMFYQDFLIKSTPILIVPCIVNIEKFNITVKRNKIMFLTYCGDIGNNKDGLPDLIKAFSLFPNQNNLYKLRIIGDTKDLNGKYQILKLIDELNLTPNVIMEGRVSHEKIPYMLKESTVLVLARPNNKQAEGGFPSKVCEYLASGVPSLITETGELNQYLTHNENVFFSPPDSPEQFSKLLNQILKNYDTSLEVAKRGQKFNEYFDYKTQSGYLLEYLNCLLKNRS